MDPRTHVGIHAERVTDVASTDFPGHYPGLEDEHSWSLERFKKGLKVQVTRLSNRSIDFDLVGVDASIANAFRRILIAEVPTVCIEHVYVNNNTSVIADEVLAHRLGMVPLLIDPALMEMRTPPNDTPTDRNTMVFTLHAACTRARPTKDTPKDTADPDVLYKHHTVRAADLVWDAKGEQTDVFAGAPPRATSAGIVLAKLRPGQEVDVVCHAVKGIGKDHAKFSPVATASYRLLPAIEITQPIPPELGEKFQRCFAPGVIRRDERTGEVSVDAANVRRDTVSREVLRHPEFADKVRLGRVRDHFLFNIESESAYAPERLLPEALAVMRGKLAVLRRAAEGLKAEADGVVGDVEMGDA